MAFEQLLLAERLVALLALVRLLVGVDKHVRLEVACRDRSVRTKVAFITFFTLVRLAVHLETMVNCHIQYCKYEVKVSPCNCNDLESFCRNVCT